MAVTKILIVAATELEIPKIISEAVKNGNNTYHLSKPKNDIDILITGLGIGLMTYHLTKQLMSNQYQFVLLAGIAGCYTSKYKIGDVVEVIEERFADLGQEKTDSFVDFMTSNLINDSIFENNDGKLINHTSISNKFLKKLPKVLGNTVNTLRSPINTKIQYGADVESMEGAAFFYVCLHEKINFAQIRSISNIVGETDKSKWDMKLSVNNLQHAIYGFIEQKLNLKQNTISDFYSK